MSTLHSAVTLLCFIVVACLAETLHFPSNALAALPRPKPRGQWSTVLPKLGAPSSSSIGQGAEALDVLDIVLVASVDGKFHALNRTSGTMLWSMGKSSSTSTPNNSSLPSSLRPLVRTGHVDIDPDVTDDDSPHQELYIIEPQSGEIFVMSTPTSPLQRLPFTMMQLVDMSPFSFSGDEDRRVFVGRKETSLMLIELETGTLKEINSECPWDLGPKEHATELDELEDAFETLPPTEVFIGRTDYHISIHTRPLNAKTPKPPVQNLSFSIYGPNNKDAATQSTYKRSADDVYVQSLPSGEVFSFQTPDHEISPSATLRPIWHSRFSSPIVAAFDVVRSKAHGDPFVLLQPRPQIEDTIPNVNDLPYRHFGHVGIVNKSLFAITPRTFPLVAFDNSRTNFESDFASVEDFTKARELRVLCANSGTDRRCLTGLRHLEDSSSWNRLLDGPSAPGLKGQMEQIAETVVDNSNINSTTWWPINGTAPADLVPDPKPTLFLSSFMAMFVGAIWLYKKLTAKTVEAPVTAQIPEVPLHPPEPVVPIPELVKPVNGLGMQAIGHTLPTTTNEKTANGYIQTITVTPLIENGDISVKHDPVDDAAEGDESDQEDDNTPERRKGKKKRRGKKKKATPVLDGELPNGIDEKEKEKGRLDGTPPTPVTALVATPTTPTLVLPQMSKATATASQLIVSDNVLGYGSHGTVVYSGSLQGRSVAVKRLLHDFVTLASREVSILQDADDHPNVIRYYYQEAQGTFLYIALELCPASLADIIERPDQFRDISVAFEPKRALKQVTAGLRHLHSLKIIHRDIKPQNILVSAAPGHRMLISDFGLCKKLDFDQTSFLPTAADAGTVGWRAPEILRGDVKLDEGLNEENSSSRGTVSGGGSGTPTKRLTKLVDIFALGCLFYYTLTNGGHPFGDRYEREVNIMKSAKPCLDGIGFERFGEEGAEASVLIAGMLDAEPKSRPDTVACLLHPFFWDAARRLAFLQDASDRFEIMCRDPKEPDLVALEVGAREIVGADWHIRLDRIFVENLGKFRKYDGRSVQDLMRALRNKKHHYQDLPDHVKRHLGPMPEGFLSYFTRRFPELFLHVHGVVATTALRQEPMFRAYFDLLD